MAHYVLLLGARSDEARRFYETEAHSRMRCERKPGAIGEEYRITIVIDDMPTSEEPLSDRARKREHERSRR